jgi:hypothetical protein
MDSVEVAEQGAEDVGEWEYDGPLAPSGAMAGQFQGQWVDLETGTPIDRPRWKRRRVGLWEWYQPEAAR